MTNQKRATEIVEIGSQGRVAMIKKIESALDEAEERGAVEIQRSLHLHGTDGCPSCEMGRITLYSSSKTCFTCAAKESK